MTYTTLAAIKAHLNIETGYTADDTYITSLIGVTEGAIADYCNGGLASYTEAEDVPVAVKHAALIMAANLYLNRSPVSFAQGYKVPYSFEFLLNPYRIYTIE